MQSWRTTRRGVGLLAASSTLLRQAERFPRYYSSEEAGPTRRRSSTGQDRGGPSLRGAVGVAASGLSILWFMQWKKRSSHEQYVVGLPFPQLCAASPTSKEASSVSKSSTREHRYKQFSSLSFKGESYMTPRDFLESVTLNFPRRK